MVKSILEPNEKTLYMNALLDVHNFLQLATNDHYTLSIPEVCESWEHYGKVCIGILDEVTDKKTEEDSRVVEIVRQVSSQLKRSLNWHYRLSINEVLNTWLSSSKLCIKKIVEVHEWRNGAL